MAICSLKVKGDFTGYEMGNQLAQRRYKNHKNNMLWLIADAQIKR